MYFRANLLVPNNTMNKTDSSAKSSKPTSRSRANKTTARKVRSTQTKKTVKKKVPKNSPVKSKSVKKTSAQNTSTKKTVGAHKTTQSSDIKLEEKTPSNEDKMSSTSNQTEKNPSQQLIDYYLDLKGPKKNFSDLQKIELQKSNCAGPLEFNDLLKQLQNSPWEKNTLTQSKTTSEFERHSKVVEPNTSTKLKQEESTHKVNNLKSSYKSINTREQISNTQHGTITKNDPTSLWGFFLKDNSQKTNNSESISKLCSKSSSIK